MDNRDIEEMFSALGPVAIKRMFGGKGVYFRGRILALEVRNAMLLKADAASAPEFEAAGATQWTYEGKRGVPVRMPLVDPGRRLRRPRRDGPLGAASLRGSPAGIARQAAAKRARLEHDAKKSARVFG